MPHGGKSNACNLFKPIIEVPVARCLPKPYKCVEQLRDILYTDERFKDMEKKVDVIGCGPSLDDFPDNFFNDRIIIACKTSVIRFQNAQFAVAAYTDRSGMMGYLKDNDLLPLLKKFIITIRYDFGAEPDFLGSYKTLPYYMRVFKDRRARYLDEAVERIFSGLPCNYPGVNTIIHFGIQVAAIMGAKKIFLIGCEHNMQSHQIHAHKGGIFEFYSTRRKQTQELLDQGFSLQDQLGMSPGWQEARLGTRRLAELLARYGVEVVRYYFKTGEEEIIGEDDSKQRYVKEIKDGTD